MYVSASVMGLGVGMCVWQVGQGVSGHEMWLLYECGHCGMRHHFSMRAAWNIVSGHGYIAWTDFSATPPARTTTLAAGAAAFRQGYSTSPSSYPLCAPAMTDRRAALPRESYSVFLSCKAEHLHLLRSHNSIRRPTNPAGGSWPDAIAIVALSGLANRLITCTFYPLGSHTIAIL